MIPTGCKANEAEIQMDLCDAGTVNLMVVIPVTKSVAVTDFVFRALQHGRGSLHSVFRPDDREASFRLGSVNI